MSELSPEYESEATTKLVRTHELTAAEFVIAASRIELLDDDPIDVLKTHDEQLGEIWHQIEDRYWFMRPEFRTKEPYEQWNMTIGQNTVPLYNYAESVKLLPEQVERITMNIARFSWLFANLAPSLEAVTVVEKPYHDPLEDDMAEAFPQAHMFSLTPYALEEGIYRPDLPVNRLDAVVLHEMAHFIMDVALEPTWEKAGYTWQRTIGYSAKLQYKADRPEDCVTTYAERGGVHEDIAESVVAYLLLGSKLADKKYEIFYHLESWPPTQEAVFEKVDTIQVPRLPDVLRYYLDTEVSDELEEE